MGFLTFRLFDTNFAVARPGWRPVAPRHSSLAGLGSWLITVEESLPEKSKFRDDLDRERKKQKILSLVLIAIVAVVVILFVVSLVRGHL